jgi:glycolate oxidase
MHASLAGIDHSAAPEDLICYGFDASGLEGRPALVAWPKGTDDISRLLRYASEENMPVRARCRARAPSS